MGKEAIELDYLMGLRLLPFSVDDDNDYHGDGDYIGNCDSVSELQRVLRFLTESKPDLIASTKKRLAKLEDCKQTTPTTEPTSTSTSSGSSSSWTQKVNGISSPATPINRQEMRRQKENSQEFVRFFMHFLAKKDKKMHKQANVILQDCHIRNRRREPGYESVTTAVTRRLREFAGEDQWRKAKGYFSEQRRKILQSRKRGAGKRDTAVLLEGYHRKIIPTN